jgi:hypothetical protein
MSCLLSIAITGHNHTVAADHTVTTTAATVHSTIVAAALFALSRQLTPSFSWPSFFPCPNRSLPLASS